ncbi:hypothetical protein B0O99DRAFT_682455 [Bisporella sp. PMI_857]|nr:hypothetical protein B0O99DRAFT_682455 [Bisporella sp. PMI_857]
MKQFIQKFAPRKAPQKDNQSRKTPSPLSTDKHGLKLVYESTTPSVDIVAIHGHGGHWKKSWIYTQPDGSDIFWLQDLVPAVLPSSRILSFGYDASNALSSAVQDIASEFLNDIMKLRCDRNVRRPLIFIAHSFGGLLIKGALGTCVQSLQAFGDLRSSIHAILFLGVPKSVEASFGNLGNMALEADDLSDPPLIVALKRDVRWLQEMNEEYNKINNEFIEIYFTETDGSSGIQPEVSTVDSESVKVIPLNKTHGAMIRFPSADDEDFKKVGHSLVEVYQHLQRI